MTTSTDGLLAIDVEAMLRECVPGGDSCDPQHVCDDIREYFERRRKALPQQPEGAAVTEPMMVRAVELRRRMIDEAFAECSMAEAVMSFFNDYVAKESPPASAVAEPVCSRCKWCNGTGWAAVANVVTAQCTFCDGTGKTKDALQPAQAATVSDVLRAQGVFKGAHGLEGLANATDFWERQPYGTRLYYGDGIADYLHIDVLRAAIRALASSPAAPAPVIPESEKGR